jgi:L-threonylcarbamoyladenylate synthase
LQAEGEIVGVMLPQNFEAGTLAGTALKYDWGNWENQEELARKLFDGLRELDASGAATILCPVPEEKGIGAAIRDRLLKAARPRGKTQI